MCFQKLVKFNSIQFNSIVAKHNNSHIRHFILQGKNPTIIKGKPPKSDDPI